MTSFNWSPGIGDPTVMGWLTVVLYVLAAISCWITARKLRLTAEYAEDARELRAWRSIAAAFLALGVNKQLDLQTALTEAGRVLAQFQGWYDQRRAVQVAFIVAVAITCLIAAIILVRWAYKAPAATWLALTGSVMVIGYVLIRAASFHHVDRFIHERFLGFRWNWILEMGGIGVVLVASYWRRSGVGGKGGRANSASAPEPSRRSHRASGRPSQTPTGAPVVPERPLT